jgi:hypothetical protein
MIYVRDDNQVATMFFTLFEMLGCGSFEYSPAVVFDYGTFSANAITTRADFVVSNGKAFPKALFAKATNRSLQLDMYLAAEPSVLFRYAEESSVSFRINAATISATERGCSSQVNSELPKSDPSKLSFKEIIVLALTAPYSQWLEPLHDLRELSTKGPHLVVSLPSQLLKGREMYILPPMHLLEGPDRTVYNIYKGMARERVVEVQLLRAQASTSRIVRSPIFKTAQILLFSDPQAMGWQGHRVVCTKRNDVAADSPEYREAYRTCSAVVKAAWGQYTYLTVPDDVSFFLPAHVYSNAVLDAAYPSDVRDSARFYMPEAERKFFKGPRSYNGLYPLYALYQVCVTYDFAMRMDVVQEAIFGAA